MSDEIKIIREALAQVQNKINEQHKQNMINEYEALKGAGEWLADRKKPGDTWYKDRANEVGDYVAYSLKKPANADTADYQAAKKSDKLSYNRKTGEVVDHSSGEPTSDVFSRMRQNSQPATNSSTPKSDTSTTTTTTPKADTPAPSSSPAPAADKPVSYDKNKYAIYQKDSASAKSFRDTFDAQKAAGADTFKWKGGDNVERTYSTKSASDTKPAAAPASTSPETTVTKPESESGGKKKKMSEETNPLIAAFLKLQSENPSNMFEAAKKLSPKQKEKMDVDHDNDIDADDLSALRAGKKGKMEEDSLPTMAKPSANADTKSVTTDFSAPDRPAVSMDNKPVVSPTAPKVDTTIPSSDKKALDTKFKTIAREEVEFSQAEIDHINSFFLEASVAPNRPEVAIGADSTSDKMSQNDVTGTHTESGGKKKIKEEVDIEEGVGYPITGARTNVGSSDRKRKAVQMTLGRKNKDHPDWNNKLNPQNAALTLGRQLQKQGVTEEETLEESMPASVIASKQKYAEMSDEDFAAKHGHKSEKELRDMAARHGYGWNKATKTGSDHYVKRVAAGMKTNEEVEKIDEILSASPKRKIPDWIKRKRNFNGRHDLVKAGNLNYDGSKKKPNAEPKKDDVKEDTIPHKQDDVDPKFKSNILTPPKAPVKKFDKKVLSKMYEEEVELEEGRPKKNPTPETTERDPRKHIQVEAGRAAAGNVIDFTHNDGSKSKITPPMGRRIVAHLQGLKPADRQAAVNKMHDSPEGLKV